MTLPAPFQIEATVEKFVELNLASRQKRSFLERAQTFWIDVAKNPVQNSSSC
jgi:hypothetical protein